MDMGRESRWEKDAMTVEIMFALVSALVVGAFVFGVVMAPALVWDLPPRVVEGLRWAGGVLGLGAAVRRVVLVLLRHDRDRRTGR
ncbi:DUF6332 family protein [Streptomyces sp. NPDC058308]|uniref:DUF6332 family protein n=1 Tax=Streptomyces sp. NPDC058308 TaxID=3346440 RepID=UPI0036E2FA4D